ncbi:MAG: 4Fe-4S binding protein [Bacillota bacterium]|nr:4Fe-4S binding protein [Bacillota bacterium]
MVILNDRCNGCGVCVPYCPVGALSLDAARRRVVVDGSLCTDCYVCIRHACARKAFEPGALPGFGDVFRHVLSDPTETMAETGVPGRGTEESKTNDVTGRVRRGEFGLCVDMGRPGVGVRLRDVDRVARAVVAAGLKLERPTVSPLGMVVEDLETGRLREDVLDQHLLSIIIEGKAPLDRLGSVLEALRRVEAEVETVFSVGLVMRADEGLSPSLREELDRLGIEYPFRAKVNVGLGRPLAEP